ncbi:glycosyltransferase family 22 protein [Lophiostoma macrostomum CBS 122681]|uniref:Mannosyltransferase n=1 Tax=Lophiostoma macrostomum CBS 122681 TaxID=1314788 RepID=A0A6A6SZT6_9PLEO|nr:glycosyltransferase family 22 protein [Lophiostoma macrostomum CBS 122681]
MWRRIYFLLILARIYFALSPSYLHPDENFQGPEVIAGRVFSYPVHRTWEFTSDHPIRSTFPLWLAYGWPMYILRWLWEGFGYEVSPSVVYWTLRVLMLTLSVVLEDWAVQELLPSLRARRVAVPLIASSYVTWTFQTHTFSNSLETLLVSWSLVLIGRIVEDKKRSGVFASSILGFLIVVGVFNRITFPAFLAVPAFSLLPHFRRKPFSLVFIAIFALFTASLAISIDTAFYTPGEFTFSNLFRNPVITPINNFLYNSDSNNLAQHGLHPRYQHFLVNLPQLLGPAFPLLFYVRRSNLNLPLLSALSGIALLSLFPHQEARFLLPAVPLILSSLWLPRPPHLKLWISSWVIFNLALGTLMGVYHQGGIVPVQMHIAKTNETVSHAFWWKTYSPPIWLLNGKNEDLKTIDLMGMPGEQMLEKVKHKLPTCRTRKPPKADKGVIYLVAPRSAYFLNPYKEYLGKTQEELYLEEVWSYRKHLNLDDMDFGDDGIWSTLARVVGNRGLVIWRVSRNCWGKGQSSA